MKSETLSASPGLGKRAERELCVAWFEPRIPSARQSARSIVLRCSRVSRS